MIDPRGAFVLRPEFIFGLIGVLLFAGVVYVGLRVLLFMFSGLFRMFCPESCEDRTVSGARVCPNSRCRRANVAVARFCGQCGTQL